MPVLNTFDPAVAGELLVGSLVQKVEVFDGKVEAANSGNLVSSGGFDFFSVFEEDWTKSSPRKQHQQ